METAGRTVLLVHGGAGGPVPDAKRATAIDRGLGRAIDAGFAAIAGGALAAVVAAVRTLEDDRLFNAGHGAVLTSAGTVELDAAVMEGAERRTGAVAAVNDVANPVELAEAVMRDGRHVLLCAGGASRFAAAHGIALADPADLVAAARRTPSPGNTVGAVCRDERGHLAVAVSTGGVGGQLAGRVGDSPICGAGFYADDRHGAACATGDGEAFIRAAACARVVDRLAAGEPPEEAARHLLDDLGRLGGAGGLIVVDRDGRIAVAHSSPHMSWAWRDGGGAAAAWSGVGG